jgi:bifunctional non-homologous end joining protein LigD
MLEAAGVLRTWALPGNPAESEPMIADGLDDHRLDYLEYEGAISRGRGMVTQWDKGTYAVVHEDSAELVVTLSGEKLNGRATLVRVGEDPQRWRFAFTRA